MGKENECVGSYSVSSYTRADGTAVSGYVRTCGVSHNPNSSSANSTKEKNLTDEEKMQQRADVLYPTMDNKTQGVTTSNRDGFEKPVGGRISSDFGYRKAPIAGASTGHSGIDIAIPIGTPIKAIADGKIVAARTGMKGYGTGVFIDHGIVNGKHIVSEYGHLSNYNVKIGDSIQKGQVIAKSGNTGISTGPHLHLTIRENKVPVDPKKYINW